MELTLCHVSRKRKGHLQDLSFTVKNGFITGLVGKNGAGKTTLFRTIMSVKKDYDGEILADGMPLVKNRERCMNRIGFVSEEPLFFMNKTAGENALLYAPLYDVFDRDGFMQRLKDMGVPAGIALEKLSKGEYIKFQLCFAAAHDSRLYLLDEATAGMDVVFKKEFFRFLHEQVAREDVAVLMSTHIEEDIDQHMDYVCLLSEGKMASFGEAAGK